MPHQTPSLIISTVIPALLRRPGSSTIGMFVGWGFPRLLLGFAVLSLFLTAIKTRALPVPNASFEDVDDGSPAGWTFTGSVEALPAAWTSEDPFDGRRALRIDARHGSQRWESTPIPARPEQKYLARWQARFRGEKAWRFRAAFCGVEVRYADNQGRVLNSESKHTGCWQTPGWRPAWFPFTTPPAAATVQFRFALETAEQLPGGFDVDTVQLEEWPPGTPPAASNLCLLGLRIEDEDGRPVAARIRIANRSGEPIRPPGAIAYERAGGAFHPFEEDACHVLVPRGPYSITVTRGLEYEPWEREVEVTQPRHDLTVRLRRPWDWRQRGWISGDHHTHLHRHGGSLFPFVDWRDALRAARSEGLDFLPFMGADHYPSEAQGVVGARQSPDFVYELTDEITEDFWGHVCPVGASPESRRDPRYDAGPMNFDRHAAIAGAGGILIYGHPYGPLGEGDGLEPVSTLGMGHVAREFPVDLALGVPCAMDLLAMEGQRNQLERKLRDLYRLWNLGFRPVVAASTDFHLDQGRQPFGAVRTYVRAAALDMAAIAKACRLGRTFATSGPLLDVRVRGAGPGEELRLAGQGEKLQVNVEAVSIGRLDRVEIVVNGQVFHTLSSAQPHRITGSCEVPAGRSLWIAARAFGPEDRHLAGELEGRPLGAGQFGHTTPVYVLVEGQPIFTAPPADAEYFLRWCEAVLAGWRRHVAAQPEQARHDAVITERLARARAVFAELAARGP